MVANVTLVLVAAGLVVLVATTRDDVNDTESFVECLNSQLADQGAVDISYAVQACIPDGCKITLTMSNESAQAACTLAGCQLPRVLLDCPDPTDPKNEMRFRPSFLLCPVNSKAGGHYGADRVETAKDLERKNGKPTKMEMGDVPIEPGQDWEEIDPPHDAVSSVGNDKRCNVCHVGANNPPIDDDTPDGTGIESQPIDELGINPSSGNNLSRSSSTPTIRARGIW